jgi:peptide/nickel transport system substrate-binding protein
MNDDTDGLTGRKITTHTVDNRGYGYVGINAFNVSVNNERESEPSKNLRKALATVLAVYRDLANNSYFGETASTIQYPISNTSWASPQPMDDGWRVAFSRDVAGKPIYTPDMTLQQRVQAALQASLGFFEAAGFVIENGRVVAGPSEIRPTRRGDMHYLEYEVFIPGGGTGDHPAFALITDFTNAMATIGITIDIRDVSDGSIMWSAVGSETADLWTAAWQASVDPDLYQTYFSGSDGNHYSVADPALDELILRARISDDQAYRRVVYRQALDIIMDWAVEVPNYQRKNFELFSTERINIDTITPMVTTHWGWRNEIELIEMR